ncbi:MAG: hypothetical protein ACE5HV_16515, partial [Acidobacteriota bacterium]
DCQIRVSAEDPDRIVRTQLMVAGKLQCERIKFLARVYRGTGRLVPAGGGGAREIAAITTCE